MSVTDPGFNPSGSDTVAALKIKANELAELIEELDPSTRKLIALQHLETASMWAVAAAVKGDE